MIAHRQNWFREGLLVLRFDGFFYALLFLVLALQALAEIANTTAELTSDFADAADAEQQYDNHQDNG
jgi:hypothetical protein